MPTPGTAGDGRASGRVEIDAILEKIKRSGLDSLSEDERQVLDQASRGPGNSGGGQIL